LTPLLSGEGGEKPAEINTQGEGQVSEGDQAARGKPFSFRDRAGGVELSSDEKCSPLNSGGWISSHSRKRGLTRD